jgi:hypothetical protein
VIEVAEFDLLALPPRWYPGWLWNVQVRPLRVVDEAGVREVAWGERVTLAIRPGTHSVSLRYTAANQPWTTSPTLATESINDQLVTYRPSSLGIAGLAKVTVSAR